MKFLSLIFLLNLKSVFAMSLAPVSSQPARCMALTPACMGNSTGYRENNYCIQCQNMNQGFVSPIPSYYPWWYGYGQLQYTNYAYPGYWQGGGLSNYYYPGNGNMAAGKPNIYFHGLSAEEASEFWFQIKYLNDSNELASAPIHDEKDGWKISQNILTKKYKIDGNEYDYLYYDYKLDSKYLQSTKGFCGERSQVYEKMVSILNTMRYKDREVSDFENYWSHKIPKGEFCVYPQDHSVLSNIAQWNSSIQPKFFKRVLFVMIPIEQIKAKVSANFTSLPMSDWNPMNGVYRNMASSSSGFQVHEWGVAFLTKK